MLASSQVKTLAFSSSFIPEQPLSTSPVSQLTVTSFGITRFVPWGIFNYKYFGCEETTVVWIEKGNVILMYSVLSTFRDSLKGNPIFERYPALEKSRIGVFVLMWVSTLENPSLKAKIEARIKTILRGLFSIILSICIFLCNSNIN